MNTARPFEKPSATLAARRTPAQHAARRQHLRRELLTSPWAPLSLLGIAFVLDVALIESLPETAAWAQPVMRGWGLAMVLASVALWGWRQVSAKARALLQPRHDASELIAEVERLLSRGAGSLPAPAVERLLEHALRVEAASIADHADTLRAEVKVLDGLATELWGAQRRPFAGSFLVGIAKALFIALLIRTVIIEPYRIPSGSMLPTLQLGDQVFINKFIYGVRIPLLNVVPFRIVRAPARGDVIVFNNPVDTSTDLIKRVVGVPGDTVEFVDDGVVINGQPQPRELESANSVVHNRAEESGAWFEEHLVLYREHLSGVTHAALQNPVRPPARAHEGPYVVPEGHVFVAGDNRDNSLDSRYGLGGPVVPAYVPDGHIKGKAMIVWLSWGYDGLLSSLFKGTGLRAERFFEPVR
ncbi:signal peptidase I [Myxococcaceae bacterium JPH2]|nr:signal peptidase I [Myxococcaceae bacterium JPH2]